MPLPTPNPELIRKVLGERSYQIGQRESFSRIQEAVLVSILDGGLTAHRAEDVSFLLASNPEVSSIFPNNVLADGLKRILEEGGWTPDTEHDLLLFMFCFYSELEEFENAARDLIKNPSCFLGDIYPWFFDHPTSPISLTGKICDFTGTFALGSRKKCFSVLERQGGAPSKRIHETDITFVARKHIDARVLSSTMLMTMIHRQRYGSPLMMSEDHFPVI